MTKLRNIHPGEVLQEEFMSPFGISQNQIARDIGVPPRRINEIVHGNRAVTADTALRLARFLHAILVLRRVFGWASRQTSTSKRHALVLANDCCMKSAHTLPEF